MMEGLKVGIYLGCSVIAVDGASAFTIVALSFSVEV